MHTPGFSTRPHEAYASMRRRFGALVPVELAPGVPGTLVIGYSEALRILYDEEHFSADPRIWQKSIPADHPLLGLMGWLPAARNSDGPDHDRYRRVSIDALDVDLYALASMVKERAVELIATFEKNEGVDLLAQYAAPLVLEALNRMIGCPPEIGKRVADGMAARFDSNGRDGGGRRMMWEALMELIALKRDKPGDDVASRLVHHPAGLDDAECFAQLMSFYGAGFEAQYNLMTNALVQILTTSSGGFGDIVLSGHSSTLEALEWVLFRDPPMANFCFKYPKKTLLFGDVWLPAHQPVVISIAACNNDPAIVPGDDLQRIGNRSHLAWAVGSHACPAQRVAYVTTQNGIDQLLDVLPEMKLAVPPEELVWRPGPFHRALASLPVRLYPRR